MLNNISFLLTFYDNWILFQDYIKLPGDENETKKHLNLKKLMQMQSKGELTDTKNWRSIRKIWKTFDLNWFRYKKLAFDFARAEGELQEEKGGKPGAKKKAPAQAAKKPAAKKPAPANNKNAKKGQKEELVAEREEGRTIPQISYKTIMQKTAYHIFEERLAEFKALFDSGLSATEERA